MAVYHVTLSFLLLLQMSFCICTFVPEAEDIVRSVIVKHEHSRNRRDIVEQALRIQVIVHSSNMTDMSSNVKHLITGKLIPDAVKYFHQTFKVRQSTSHVILQQKCKSNRFVHKNINGDLLQFCVGECEQKSKCGPVSIPTEHLDICRSCDQFSNCTNGTSMSKGGLNNTDFVLYVSGVATTHCNSNNDVIAYAATCQLEYVLDRPIAGFVNFCPASISQDIHYSHLLAIVKHEMYHALGFSSALYGYYRDDDGAPLTNRASDGTPVIQWSDKVVKEIVRKNWHVSNTAGTKIVHKVEMIVTPRVLQEVRQHFNCSTLQGAEIENQGGKGRQQTHWEKRLFENEAMTGVFTHNPVFSRITLALMEDTGWYRANYDMADSLDWGENAGCLFAQSSCKSWMDNKAMRNESILPFCKDLGARDHTKTTCTHGYDSVGTCNLVQYNSTLPQDYQYFNTLVGITTNPGRYGGAVMLADYCPYIQELDWKKNGKIVRRSNCKYPSNNLEFDKNYALENYSAKSSCFQHGSRWKRKSCSQLITAADWGSGCYQYTCSKFGIVLSVMGWSFPCFISGATIEIKFVDDHSLLHEGSVICPPCQDLCNHACPKTQNINEQETNNQYQQDLVCKLSKINSNFGILFLSFLLTCLL